MAGPSLIVRLLGDMTGLGKSFDDAGAKGASAGAKMHSTFSSLLGQLNQTGVLGPFGAALAGADEAMQKLSGHGKQIGTVMMGAGGAMLGLGTALQQLGSKDQQAHQQLQAAVQATGHSYDQYAEKVDKAIKTQEHYGHTADQTQDALRTLTQATGDPAKALQMLGTASDLAAAKHEDLNTAAGQLGKTYNGAAKLLKEFGLTATPTATKATAALDRATRSAESAADAQTKAHQKLGDVQALLAGKTSLNASEQIRLRDAQQNVAAADAKAEEKHKALAAAQEIAAKATSGHNANIDALSKKLSGQASAAADTFSGKISALRAHIMDSASAFAQKWGPAITAAGAVMTGLGAAMQVVTALKESDTVATIAYTVAQVASTIATTAWAAATWLLNAALAVLTAPITIIIAAVALFVVGIILAYQHCTVFRNVVNDMGHAAVVAFNWIIGAASAVWNWIASHWPLLLAILTGPFGLAVYMIANYWNQIVAFAASIPGRIMGALAGLGGLLVGLGAAMINGLAAGMSAAWGGVAGFVAGLPGRILNGLGNIASLLYNAGVTIIDSLGRGIREAAQHVFDFVSGIAGKIASLKGPLDRDRTLLVPHGTAIMKGFHDALSAGLADVNMLMASVAPNINATVSPAAVTTATNSGPAVVVQNAHFNSDVDIDAFMQRAAWVARTAGL